MPSMTPRPIIIDTDPGQDDAVAMLLALASPEELRILGVTAVAGNVPLSLTEKNARRICELAGRPDTPVYAGCARPMVRAPRHGGACPRQDRVGRPGPAGTGDGVEARPHGRFPGRYAAGGRRRLDHAVHAAAADQPGHGAGQESWHRAEDP